jgi:hypothetical protein
MPFLRVKTRPFLLSGLVLLCACGSTSSAKPPTPPGDSTAAIQAMVDAGQTIPAGSFLVTHIRVVGRLRGAGRDATRLREILPHTPYEPAMVEVRADGAIVEDVTLDGHGSVAIDTRNSRTTLRRSRVQGGSPIGTFALYYANPAVGVYSIGNRVLDTIIEDTSSDDGFSFSFQKDALIENVTHLGSRLALYHVSRVLVENYKFTPRVRGRGDFNYTGLWVTPSSDHITIRHWRGGHPRWGGGVPGQATTDSTMSDVVVDSMLVGDVNGFLLDRFRGSLDFNPHLSSASLTIANSHLNSPVDNPVPQNVHATWYNTAH